MRSAKHRTGQDEGYNNLSSEQRAIISHYLHNRGTKYDRPYKEEAKRLIGSIYGTYDCADRDRADCLQDELNINSLLPEFFDIPFPAHANHRFTFIDLFAGIGGFRLALQNLGGKCVFSSEIDIAAQKTYLHNYGDVPFGDITKASTKAFIPDGFDILCAGFPCQAFSVAGKRLGFEDTRGTLFFEIADILSRYRPKAFFLENVKNLQAHNNGKTFEVIKQTLSDLGYTVHSTILNSMTHANIPQNRERIFIVGFDPQRVARHEMFSFPEEEKLTTTIHDCIDYNEDDERLFYREGQGCFPMLRKIITSMDTIYQYRRVYVRENKSNVCPTLTANMGEGGHNVPLILTPGGIRKLSPKECLRFQGYPPNFSFPQIAQSAKYKQAGNSVTVPLIQRVAGEILSVLL